VHDLSIETPCGARLMATGPFGEEDLGVSCYHSKTGAVELYLNHLCDGPREYVVVDCTAGADSFSSGLFSRFDLTVLVAEPTRKGIGVYQQWLECASGFDVAVVVAGNKVQSADDVAFLRERTGGDLLTWFGFEPAVRALEQGRHFELADLSPATRDGLAAVQGAVDARSKDWDKFLSQAGVVHLKNARAWANAATGLDLTDQIDPDFVMPGAEPAFR
jgi:CO dehydrogenase maturation factor